MFISSETKAAIGQWQRSCSDFPCSIHFDFILGSKREIAHTKLDQNLVVVVVVVCGLTSHSATFQLYSEGNQNLVCSLWKYGHIQHNKTCPTVRKDWFAAHIPLWQTNNFNFRFHSSITFCLWVATPRRHITFNWLFIFTTCTICQSTLYS